MVLKKKKEIRVNSVSLEGPKLDKLKLFADAEGKNLASLLLRSLELADGVEQIHCIKLVAPFLEEQHKSSICPAMIQNCLEVLTTMYFSVDSKNPLKKVLSSSLDSFHQHFSTEACYSFTSYLREELHIAEHSVHRQVLDNLSCCMENFPLGFTCVTDIFMEVLQYLQGVLRTLQDQNRTLNGNRIAQTQVMHNLLMAVKISMILVQRVQNNVQEALRDDRDSPIWKSMCGLLNCFSSFLIDEELLQNVQSTSAMAVILYLKIMFEPAEKLPRLVSNLLLRSVDSAGLPDWFLSSCGSLCKEDVPDSVLLFLCHGALAMLDWGQGRMGWNGEKLLPGILSVLLSLSSRLKESSVAMLLSRILAMWTSTALDVLNACSQDLRCSLNGNTDTLGTLLEYVYTHWEHPLDAVRHQTKVIFKNLLQIHMSTMDALDIKLDPFFSRLTKSLLSLEWHTKGKYASLACLVDCVGVESILAIDRTIPAQILEVMGDQSFAPYASNLLEAMFVNHKDNLRVTMQGKCWIDQWHEAWVSPLLFLLCEGKPLQTTYIIDYYLPKLLKCSPESLSYMVKILNTSAMTNVGSTNSRGALGALMACLRTARAHGHMQFTDHFIWVEQVSNGIIRQGLVHRHDQVRIDALGLLCESHRSTEVVSMEEMELVLFFIMYNLNSQAPSVRQQICCLMKKLFCRIQESSQVLYKLEQHKNKLESASDPDAATWNPSVALKHYEEFMLSLTNSLFEALFPGSSHPTRFSALTILETIAEIFSTSNAGQTRVVFALSRAVTYRHVEALIECFTNSFEEVKRLAFDLLRKLPANTLGLQDPQKFQTLLRAAMDLSTSTKHFDCVTASYMLNFLIHQEGLESALKAWLMDEHGSCSLQMEADVAAGLVEKNTLNVVRCLLANLEHEITLSEKSLLQAAALFPMYGRVHCINGALQQVSLRNLSMVTEWRKTVADLILMSYRLSAVVSPIVHSSSPEGLIPMDTDAECAAQLQMILNEIQPRDTNDYFTQARILQEHHGSNSNKPGEGNEPLENVCTDMAGEEACCVTAQMVLVCCWRSMKEISLLLGMLCQRLPLQSGSHEGLITVEQVKDMGEYFKHHLLQSRHRGAFELAYVGFAKLTEMLIGCNNENLRCLPQEWLYNVLEEIKSSDPSSKLCATRRSAGIPFYIQLDLWEQSKYSKQNIGRTIVASNETLASAAKKRALLGSEPKNCKDGLLKRTMKELISLAMPLNEPQSTIPQVHALNILRALFRDTRLGENIIPYVADGTQAAILGFTSPVWAVRNSSTLLFSTLITRIFGVKRGKDENSKKNRMTGREFFSRFPSLYPFLLKQLEIVANTVDSDTSELKLHPSLFLLLLILGKLYPSPMDGTHSALSMAPFVPFVMRCGHSPVYRSREMAARALVPFVMVDNIPKTVLSLLNGLPNCTDKFIRQNHIHGTLLQVLHLLQPFLESKHRPNSGRQKELHDITISMKAKLWLAARKNPCLVTRAAYLEVMVLLSNFLIKSKDTDVVISEFWMDIDSIIIDSELMSEAHPLPAAPGLTQYLQSVAKLAISALSLMANPDPSSCLPSSTVSSRNAHQLLLRLLHSEFHEVRLLILEAVLMWLKHADLKQDMEESRPLSDSSCFWDEIFLKLAFEENHPDCFCKVLEILFHMDTKKLLLSMAHSKEKDNKELLKWVMSIADSSYYSVEIQGLALKLSSKLAIYFTSSIQESSKLMDSELKQWVRLVSNCCVDESLSEIQMGVAEVLIEIAPVLLTNQNLILDLSDTLILWNCIFMLLQSEEPAVRDTTADIIRVHHCQEQSRKKAKLEFCVVNPPMAMDLAFGILCDLLQQWDQVPAGTVILLEWLLGEDDLKRDLEDCKSVEDEYLFEKGEANFWAEKLIFVRLTSKHLRSLTPAISVGSDDISQLFKRANSQAQLVGQRMNDLPPSPQFSKTAEYTRLLIQKERISAFIKILNILNKDGMDRDTEIPEGPVVKEATGLCSDP
ncbi:tRNA (32-2'-O)-methyltransferase regulator THADA isoform X1 [Pleurodeles waltl]|uniref:tRNA (32-2'-O)-methyltransferase regulator THADA isoform X1 n=1 Tax=Pleurodeles waltl TaxID=8319 RepID=UPI00370959D8